MQIPDPIRKCVVFVGFEKSPKPGQEGAKHAGGTAFVVGCPVPGLPGRTARFVVTARHVLDEIQNRGDGRPPLLRINVKGGSAAWFEAPASAWFRHDDPAVDVAVWPFRPQGSAEADVLYYPCDSFVTEDVIEKERIGPGDELFFPGLFRDHFGAEKNIPIIRVGNIAAMPEEPVHTRHYGKMTAYLVESRSIGGLSGSPVFVYVGKSRLLGGSQVNDLTRKAFYLLGLIHGHWDWPMGSRDSTAEDWPSAEKLNMGIAIATPATRILEILSSDPVQQLLSDETARWKTGRNRPPQDTGKFST